MLAFKEYIKHPNLLGISILEHYGQWLADSTYLKLMFRFQMGHRLNLRNPNTFSEKIQWLKLFNRRPEYTTMVDKYAVKKLVARIIGDEYIIPTLGVWEKPEDIEWDMLPDQFVLKTTHGGGSEGVVICKDKNTFNKKIAINKLNVGLKMDLYQLYREWPYKNVPKRIIAEVYIEPLPETNDLPDYKFFCFNGEPKFCQVISGRGSKMCIDFYDQDWNHQPFHEPKDYPFADIQPQRPIQFEKMWQLAGRLAKDTVFSRIDFYNIKQHIYFGEITFYPTSGFGGFNPKKFDDIFGQLIILPYMKKK